MYASGMAKIWKKINVRRRCWHLDPINNAMQSSRCKGRLQSKLMLVHRCKWKITINLWAASYTKHASFSLGKVKNIGVQVEHT